MAIRVTQCCCCCCGLRVGVQVLGIILIVLSSLGLLGNAIGLMSGGCMEETFICQQAISTNVVSFIIGIIYLIIHVLLFVGAKVGNRCMLMPYLIAHMFGIVIYCISVIIYVILGIVWGIISITIWAAVLGIPFICLMIYLWIVVQSLYMELGDKSNVVIPMNQNYNQQRSNKY